MESILESEWSVNAMYSTEESDFISQLISYCSISNLDHILATNHDFVFCNEEENESLVQLLSRANVHEKSKKRSTNSVDVQKNKKQKPTQTSCTNKEQNVVLQKQSSSSCSSENDSIASRELTGDASNSSESKEATSVNSNGQLRAVRGSATDPQSLYARKRRERINERLRTLQNLVPNGTKVDISTMLEDAVQYVKFLQLQIKLLSSDDEWMYAPIAYNGTNGSSTSRKSATSN